MKASAGGVARSRTAPENRGGTGGQRQVGQPETATGRRRSSPPLGRRFQPGVSGNAGGRPKGAKTYVIRQFWAEALEDPQTRKKLVECLREAVSRPKTVVPALESAAKVNRELGMGADMPVGSITINVMSPVRGERLRREPS